MQLWIRLITWSRIPFATAVALSWMFGKFELGAWMFAIGLLTKAADTPLSVWRKCPIPANDEFYRLVAMLFNGAAVVSITAGYSIVAYYRGNTPWLISPLLFTLLPLLTTATLLTVSRIFIKPHSLLAKARSGVISAVVLLFVAPFSPLWLSMASFGFIWLGEGYKVLYYANSQPTA